MTRDTPKSNRIRTDPGEGYGHRYDVIQEVADFWNVGNNTDAIVKSCDLAGRVLPQLVGAIEAADIRPSEKAKLIAALETRNISADYERGDISIAADD